MLHTKMLQHPLFCCNALKPPQTNHPSPSIRLSPELVCPGQARSHQKALSALSLAYRQLSTPGAKSSNNNIPNQAKECHVRTRPGHPGATIHLITLQP